MAQLRSRIDTGEGDQREPEALEIKQLVNPQRSSGGEHCLHTAGVAGSNPAAPTIFFLCLQDSLQLVTPVPSALNGQCDWNVP